MPYTSSSRQLSAARLVSLEGGLAALTTHASRATHGGHCSLRPSALALLPSSLLLARHILPRIFHALPVLRVTGSLYATDGVPRIIRDGENGLAEIRDDKDLQADALGLNRGVGRPSRRSHCGGCRSRRAARRAPAHTGRRADRLCILARRLLPSLTFLLPIRLRLRATRRSQQNTLVAVSRCVPA
jgi:hypothetical protein